MMHEKLGFTTITQSFLSEFEHVWVETLERINCNQGQLLVGSRLRPQITLWGYLSGPEVLEDINFNLIAEASVSIEMIHKASLLIDDWIDGDQARHGEATFHVSFGPQKAVVIAVHMVSEAMRRLKQVLPSNKVPPTCHFLCVDLIAETVHAMSLGLLRELELNSTTMLNVGVVKNIAQQETAEILGNGMLMGYYIGGGSNGQVASIFKAIGDQCGYLFQTMNDLEAFSNAPGNAEHKGGVNFDVDAHRKNLAIAQLHQFASNKDKAIISSGTGAEIAALMIKYRMVDIILEDMEVVYKQILKNTRGLSKQGICNQWIDGFVEFMRTLKTVAGNRLKSS